jgi:hypothetical protein
MRTVALALLMDAHPLELVLHMVALQILLKVIPVVELVRPTVAPLPASAPRMDAPKNQVQEVDKVAGLVRRMVVLLVELAPPTDARAVK